ncbi:Uu.00g067680.m01.CDS01 [Anthostomella pinea]|uniref:Uu.00g067680.m01.CDS01 n=1 Tax=Anthostomella pinea TaxID=933095 RepID=A0AAI8VVE0_9PEZI|nr:Uu.00g067680.m01.CDS01 [Anthostomella pinea]
MKRLSSVSLLSWWGIARGAQEVFQAAPPPRTSFSDPACQQTIFQHDYGNSYGAPYVGPYSPPSDCNFTTTIFNMSVVSSGRQYDRLATLWVGDIEVWRTSTAMPSQSGIHWSFQKDMTVWDALLRTDAKIIFELNNVIDGDRYTGFFNVTLEALYFDDVYEAGCHPAEQILPISTLSSSKNMTSVFTLPGDSGAVDLTFPRNTKTAVVSIMASGNGAEAFWFTNVPTEYVNTFPTNEGWLYGYSPFREVQLLIDGRLAGVSWPFPILFTGGVDPGAWRPIVGIDAFELPSFEIDVTPWMGLLTDELPHTFQLQVVGFDTSVPGGVGPVGDNWWASGSVFVWIDDTVEQTTATEVISDTPAPLFDFQPKVGTYLANNGTVTNTSLYFALTANRSLTISSTITSGGESRGVSWVQAISYSNIQNMTDLAFNQSLAMVTSGSHSSSASDIISRYTYPMNLFSAYVVQSTGATSNPGSVFCMVDRSKVVDGVSTLPLLTGTSSSSESLKTRQNVTSDYHWNSTIVEGTAGLDTMDGEVWLSYSGAPGASSGVTGYHRYAKEKNDNVIADEEGWFEIPVPSTEPLPVVQGEPENKSKYYIEWTPSDPLSIPFPGYTRQARLKDPQILRRPGGTASWPDLGTIQAQRFLVQLRIRPSWVTSYPPQSQRLSSSRDNVIDNNSHPNRRHRTWCLGPAPTEHTHYQCANDTAGTAASDFQTICCNGDIVNVAKPIWWPQALEDRSVYLADMVCCQGSVRGVATTQTECNGGQRPTPLASLANTNTDNAASTPTGGLFLGVYGEWGGDGGGHAAGGGCCGGGGGDNGGDDYGCAWGSVYGYAGREDGYFIDDEFIDGSRRNWEWNYITESHAQCDSDGFYAIIIGGHECS